MRYGSLSIKSVLGWHRIHDKTSTVLPSPISSAKMPPGGDSTNRGFSSTRLCEKGKSQDIKPDILTKTSLN